MGIFAETANVDYCLSFADQGKQTSIFLLEKTNGSLPFSISSSFPYKYIEEEKLKRHFCSLRWQHMYRYTVKIYVYIYISRSIYISISIYMLPF
jgi:hypothetical protein